MMSFWYDFVHLLPKSLALTEMLKNSSCFPCKHFMVKIDAVQTIRDEKALHKFFEAIVNHVTELELERNGERLFPRRHPKSLNYDSLKKLSISVNRNAKKSSTERNIMSARLLVKRAPNLETLAFKNKQNSNVAIHFLKLLHTVQVSNLKTLEWQGYCELNHFKMLTQYHFRLQTLVLGIPSNCEVSSTEIKILLESLKDTLENLVLFLNQSARQELPTLPMLKYLKFGELIHRPLPANKSNFRESIMIRSYQLFKL